MRSTFIYLLLGTFSLIPLSVSAQKAEEPIWEEPITYYDIPQEELEPEPTGIVSFGESQLGVVPETSSGGTVTVFLEPPRYAYPSLARLRPPLLSALGGSCTATLIHPGAILTAAHCVLDKQGRAWSRFLVEFRPTEADPQGHRQTVVTKGRLALHRGNHTVVAEGGACFGTPKEAGYLCFDRNADLAVLRLNAPVPDATTRVVARASSIELESYSFFTVIGYGLTFVNYETGAMTGTARLGYYTSDHGPITLTLGSLADRSFGIQGTAVVNGEIVAVALCHGDSGGPFYIADPARPSVHVLAGVNHAVTSGGSAAACAVPGNTSVLVGVLGNKDFIDAALAGVGL